MKEKIENTAPSLGAKLFNYRIKLFKEDNTDKKEDYNGQIIRRMIELDILRAIAILLVLGRHVLDIPGTLSPLVRHSFLIWREVGWIGVDLFFVLSGLWE